MCPKNKIWLISTLLVSAVFLEAVTTSAAQTKKVAPTGGRTFAGIVSATTNPSGTATYITIPGEKGAPLDAAFVVQYDPATPSPINFTRRAHMMLSEEGSAHRPLALTVRTEDGKCWIFETDIYDGNVPTGCQSVDGVAGLAHFSWPNGATETPQAHQDFVQQREKVLATITASPQDSCGCSGGCGASECSCFGQGGNGCQVTCNANKQACCSGPGSCACIPPCQMSARGLLPTNHGFLTPDDKSVSVCPKVNPAKP